LLMVDRQVDLIEFQSNTVNLIMSSSDTFAMASSDSGASSSVTSSFLSTSFKNKDLLYRSVRFRIATFGEDNANAPYRPGSEQVIETMDHLSDSVFAGYPKIRGNIARPDAARVFGACFKKLPRAIKERVIFYV
jgi:hypothetical protein